MKRVIYYTSLVLSFLAAASCQKTGKAIREPQAVTLTINASSTDGVKTQLSPKEGGYDSYWTSGDVLAVYADAVNNTPAAFTNGAASGATATFTGTISVEDGQHTIYAFYPKSAFDSYSEGTAVKVSFPSVQNGGTSSFDPAADILIAKAESIQVSSQTANVDNMSFARLGSVLQIVLKDGTTGSALSADKISSINLKVEGATLAGKAIIDLANPAIGDVSEGQDNVTLDFEENEFVGINGQNKTFAIVLPCSVAAGTAITVSAATDLHIISKTITAPAMEFPLGKLAVLNVTVLDANVKSLDTHPAGTVFYSEDFNWIKDSWSSSFTKYGWPSVKLDGSHWNEYTIGNSSASDTKTAFTGKGYVYNKDCNGYTYVKYEGYIKLGSSSKLGLFRTLALDGQNGTTAVDAGKVAKLMLTFDSSIYVAAGGDYDTENPWLDVTVEGSGKIIACGDEYAQIAQDGKSVKVKLYGDEDHRWKFITKNVLVAEADNTTRFVFGGNVDSGTRPIIENIKITRAENSATTAAADAFAPLPAKETDVKGKSVDVEGINGTATITVRINRPWTITSDASWATFKKIGAGTTTTSAAVVATDKLSATEPGTWLPYTITIACADNIGNPERQAHITVTDSEGSESVITITQAMGGTLTEIAKWTFTSLYTDTFTNKDVSYIPNENAKKNARAWCDSDKKGTHDVLDDYHNAATLSGVKVSTATFTYSTATSGQVWNRLRLKGMTKDDYFQFKINSLTAKSGDIIQLKYVYLCAANGGNTPQSWAEQYSYDGTNWTTIKTMGPLADASSSWIDLSCAITLDRNVSAAPFYIRAVALTDAVAPTNSIPYIAVDPNISTASYASRTKYYTDAKDFITINLISL